MSVLKAPAGAVEGFRLQRLAAPLVVLGLCAVAVFGVVTNIANRGKFPRLPLSGIIGPARTAELRFAQVLAKGDVSPQLAARAKRAAANDVLAYEPFLFAAATDFRDSRSTGTPRSVPLLREAIRRNPRSRAGRVMLLRRAVGADDLGQAIGELATLNLLNEDVAVPMLRSIGRSATTIPAVTEAARALADHPELFGDYVSGFVATPKPAAVVIRLAQSLPPSALSQPRVRDALVARLVQDGSYGEARRIAMGGPGRVGATAAVADPGFARNKSTPPFGWNYTQSEIGVAERSGPGAVFVDYYGRTPGTLLEQLMTLGPGAYRVEMDYVLQGSPSGTIALEVRCVNSHQAALRTWPFAKSVKSSGTAAIPFTVPVQGCAAQSLALVGLSSDRREAQQVSVSRIDVKRMPKP